MGVVLPKDVCQVFKNPPSPYLSNFGGGTRYINLVVQPKSRRGIMANILKILTNTLVWYGLWATIIFGFMAILALIFSFILWDLPDHLDWVHLRIWIAVWFVIATVTYFGKRGWEAY